MSCNVHSCCWDGQHILRSHKNTPNLQLRHRVIRRYRTLSGLPVAGVFQNPERCWPWETLDLETNIVLVAYIPFIFDQCQCHYQLFSITTVTTSSTSMIYIVFSMFTVHPFLVIIFVFEILCSSRGSHQDQPGCSDARGTALVSCARRLVWVLYWTAFPVVTPCRCVALGGLLHSTQCVQRRF